VSDAPGTEDLGDATPGRDPNGLAAALAYLCCPHCGEGLALDGATVRCGAGHSFDVARQGYVNLLAGGRTHAGDSAEMIAARERFLGGGHYAALVDAVAAACARAAGADGCVVELGAGTGHYLAAALGVLPDRVGVALDVSAPALRRAARAHPRMAALGADVWGRVPVRDGAAAVVLSVFSPRNGPEVSRMLAPDGALVVAAPTDRHLAELVGALGLVRVDPRKAERLERRVGEQLTRVDEQVVEVPLALDHSAVEALVWMGPSARHADPEAMAGAVAQLPEPVPATASVTVSTYRRPGG
jgi:23S rRNA (guanine745-N1)-methyltransferase